MTRTASGGGTAPGGWGSGQSNGPDGGWGSGQSAGWSASPSPSPQSSSRRSFAGGAGGTVWHTPKTLLVWVAIGAAVVSLILSALPLGLAAWIAAWVLAGFVGFGAALAFLQRDAVAQSRPGYVPSTLVPWLYRLAIVLSLLGVVASAVRIALVIGRMG